MRPPLPARITIFQHGEIAFVALVETTTEPVEKFRKIYPVDFFLVHDEAVRLGLLTRFDRPGMIPGITHLSYEPVAGAMIDPEDLLRRGFERFEGPSETAQDVLSAR